MKLICPYQCAVSSIYCLTCFFAMTVWCPGLLFILSFLLGIVCFLMKLFHFTFFIWPFNRSLTKSQVHYKNIKKHHNKLVLVGVIADFSFISPPNFWVHSSAICVLEGFLRKELSLLFNHFLVKSQDKLLPNQIHTFYENFTFF